MDHEPKAGTFSDATPEEEAIFDDLNEKLEANGSEDLIEKYLLYKEKFKPKCDVVYYPSCSTDSSPSVAFPKSRVIYVDIEEKAVTALKEAGLESYKASALEYDPGEVDILILLNPQISPEIPCKSVVNNGYVLSNDYHGTASALRGQEEFEFKSIIRFNSEGELIADTEDLEKCWQEIETEEEFKKSPFSWGSIYYKIAKDIVKKITGKTENVLAEYRNIIEMARDQIRERNEQKEEHPDGELVENPDSDLLHFQYGDEWLTIDTRLPKKKGTVDDIFIFEKVKAKKGQ